MSVELLGADKVIARLARLKETLNKASEKVIKDIAILIRDDAKTMCPVDTGSLRKSIRLQVYAMPATYVHRVGVSAGGYVTNPKTKRKVDYAVHVEYGTSRSRAQPFIRPAVARHKNKLPKNVKNLVRE